MQRVHNPQQRGGKSDAERLVAEAVFQAGQFERAPHDFQQQYPRYDMNRQIDDVKTERLGPQKDIVKRKREA